MGFNKNLGLVVTGALVGYTVGRVVNRTKSVDADTIHHIDEYLLDRREDAEAVLEELKDNANKYGDVSLSDYYELIGVQSRYVHNAYGWSKKTIDKAKVVKYRRSYKIEFPPVEELNL
jgi:hypothetical protein